MLTAQKEVQEMAHEKPDSKIQATLLEDKLQESLSLQLRVKGLPSMWSTTKDTFKETIDKLNNILQPIIIKPNTISWINDTKRCIPPEHCVLTFKNKEERVKLLCQSHLLMGTTL